MKKKVLLLILFVLLLSLLSLIGCNKTGDYNRTNYIMEINFDAEEMKASVSETVTYTNNTESTLSDIAFHLYPNAFREDADCLPVSDRMVNSAYPDGLSYGGINILRVESDNNQMTYSVDKQVLTVDKEVKPDETISLDIKFSLILPKVNHRFGYSDYTVNLANFYPEVCVIENNAFRSEGYYPYGDPFYSDVADYKIDLKVDNAYKIASTGEVKVKSANVNTSTYSMEADCVRDFAIVMSKNFNILTNNAGGVEVNYYYYKDENPDKSLDAACNAMSVFQDLIGKYPYKTYDVVETEFVHGGMEYPQLVYISSALTDQREKVIVHETVHQWFYGLIGNDSINEAWMDEGMTEFMTALYYKETDREDVMKQIVNSSYNAYLSYNNARLPINISKDTTMTRALPEYSSEYDYITMVYTKGLLMFNTVYEIVGHNDFIKGVRRYYSKFCYKNADGDDMIAEFNSVSNKATEKVFDAWLNGKAIITSVI